jgi:hypothetical protein
MVKSVTSESQYGKAMMYFSKVELRLFLRFLVEI